MLLGHGVHPSRGNDGGSDVGGSDGVHCRSSENSSALQVVATMVILIVIIARTIAVRGIAQ